MSDLPETCSTREAAKRLNVVLSTVQSWVEAGFLEAWKTPGGHRRVTLASIDRLLKKGMTSPAVEVPKALRLLVVEDEAELREVYADYLRAWKLPVAVTLAADGYEGLLRAGLERPHLIFTDLKMPGIDGRRMIRALQADPATITTEIVVVTGLSRAELEARGSLPQGMQLFEKPIPFESLREILVQRIAELGIVAPSPPTEVTSS
ncbi:MAG: response regulator [Pseudomonadota bacterium]